MKKIRGLFLGILVWFIYSLLRFTWRVTYHESIELKNYLKTKTSFILAHWHGDEIPLLQIGRRYRLATMSSISADGEMMSVILFLLGVKVSRGSSSNRSVGGLIGLIRLVKSGYNCSFAVDGPKGPIYKVKPGIFELSRSQHLPIVVGTASCDRAWRFPKSWNKAYLPKPFARIHLVFNTSLAAIEKHIDPRSESLQKALESELNAARQQAAKFVAETTT